MRPILLLTLIGCTAPPAVAPTAPAAFTQLNGAAFGTTWSVTVRQVAATKADLATSINAILARIDSGMSTWRDDSEVSRFARAPAGPFFFSAETAAVVSRALEVARETAGAFDPTVGPLVALWGFGAKARRTEPTPAELDAGRAAIGFSRLRWLVDGSLDKTNAALSLDLSAIAKGYAVDAIAAELARLGAAAALIEIGGEVVAWGDSPRGGAWKLAIDSPRDHPAAATGMAAIVTLRRGAMATSGDYRQFRFIGGKRLQHSIDPRTGRPADHGLASVTVIAPDCMTADAYATALMVLGAEAGLAFVEARPLVEALFLVRNKGGFRRIKSSKMGAFLIQAKID
jgi:thiamine biosynthesis lipoprotein